MPTLTIEWLLKFLQQDLDSLQPGELIDLRQNARQFRDPRPALAPDVARARIEASLAKHYFDPPLVELSGTLEEITQSARALLAPLQERLRAGVEALDATDLWVLTVEPEKRPTTVLELYPDGQVVRRFSGRFEEVFLQSAADLLARWWPELRRCKYERCGAWFLPRHGRQLYHDAPCSAVRRQETWRAEHGRDYQAEHKKRAERKHGRKMKVQHRRKKKGGAKR